MRILIANLKLFCHCVTRWWVMCLVALPIVGSCMLPGSVSTETVLSGLVLGSLSVGLVLGMMQESLRGQMCLFCLPRPYNDRRRPAFFIGFFVAFIAAFVFVGLADRFDVGSHHMIPVVGSVFSASLLVCLLATTVPALALALFLGFWWILSVFVTLYVPSWPGTSVLLERAVIHYPSAVIIVAVVGVTFSWFRLTRSIDDLRDWPVPSGKTDNALYRFCARTLAASERKDSVDPWISTVLLEKTRCSPHDGSAKHVWSSLYLWFHPRGSGRTELIHTPVFAAALAVLVWYIPFAFLIVVGIMLWLGGHRWPIHSEIMTVGGRYERFISTMVRLVASGGIFTLSVILTFVALDAFQTYLPESTARALEIELGHSPLDLGAVILTLTLIPLSCLTQLALASRFRTYDYPMWIIWLPLIPLSVFGYSYLMKVPFLYAATAFVFSWAICTVGVYCIAVRSDLVVRGSHDLVFGFTWRDICEAVVNQQNRGERCAS